MSKIGLYFSENLTQFLAIICISLCGLWFWLHHHFSYWKRNNVPYIEPNFIFGNFKDIFTWKVDICTLFQKIYNDKCAKGQPVVGLYVFNKPGLLIRDLNLVKSILIKDFHNFADRYSSSDPHSDSLGADNLFFVKNPKWKEIRTKLTPVFTSGKIKQMFPLIAQIGKEFDNHLCTLTKNSPKSSVTLEVKDLNALYTTDVIASVAYGVQANSLKDPNSDFRRNGKRIFHFTKRRALEFNSMFFLPSIVRFCGFKVFSKESSKFIKDTIEYVMGERIKSGIKRNDLIDVLVDFRKQAELAASSGNKNHFILEGDCLVAQAAVFFTAGFETTSSTLSFALYELAKHQDLQKRLREEIREKLKENNGEITYEMVMEMKFLDNVIHEVLRLYPLLPFLDRVHTSKGYSLKPFGCFFTMPNGMPVFIPVHSLHRDPEYFPEPDIFNPDRFAPENKDKVNLNAYMPFGVGPHNCIGERFGLVQVKVGLISFLRNHCVTSPPSDSHKVMKFDPRAVIIHSLGGINCCINHDPLL